MINYLLFARKITKINIRISTLKCVNYNNEIFDKLKKTVLLSKLIYDYDFVKEQNSTKRENYYINTTKNVSFTNITVDFIKKNNIFFNIKQFVSVVDKNDFLKNTKIYFNLLNEQYQQTQIYGYFYNKQRLHSLILLNHQDKEIVVAFRGSQYIEEWIDNMLFMEKQITFDKEHKIHRGIFDMYKRGNVDNNIVYILENLFYYFPDYKKIFTGHSKGSVNCILLVNELLCVLNKKYDYEIYTFGNPPVYNYKFGSYIHNHPNIKIYNVINDNDIVTNLPIFGRYHVGTEIELKNNKISFVNHNKPYKKPFDYKRFYVSIKNHNLNNYIRKIYETKEFDKD